MSDEAKDELLLTLKEMLRRAKKMESTEGADEITPALPHGLDINDMESALHDCRAGLITHRGGSGQDCPHQRLA